MKDITKTIRYKAMQKVAGQTASYLKNIEKKKDYETLRGWCEDGEVFHIELSEKYKERYREKLQKACEELMEKTDRAASSLLEKLTEGDKKTRRNVTLSIIGMIEADIENGGGSEKYEVWCKETQDFTKEEKAKAREVKGLVDKVTEILTENGKYC